MAEIDQLAALRTRFIVRLSADAERLTELSGTDGGDPQIIDIVHKLAGLAGMLGFAEISRIANQLDAAYGPAAGAGIGADHRLGTLIGQIRSDTSINPGGSDD